MARGRMISKGLGQSRKYAELLKAAGKPDPAPPLPPTDAPQKIEVEIVSKPNESNTPKNP